MADLLITNAAAVLLDRTVYGQSLLCKEGKIAQIASSKFLKDYPGAEVVDAGGAYLVSGFIDVHTHGVYGYSINGGAEQLSSICKLLPRYGVTGFLPTLTPLPKGEDADFLASLAGVKPEGADILGFHLEGPFLAFTGAMKPGALAVADEERVKALIEAAKPFRAIFSISPDLDGIGELLPVMTQQNTPAFITHTKADVSQTLSAIALGARHATHFYDVFFSPEESEPGARPCGAVEAILADPQVSVDFILDGEHVDPIAVKMALQCKGPDRVCLITDSVPGAGLAPGRYESLEGREVEFAYPGAPARLKDDRLYPGGLAGSGLTMDRAFRNAVKMLDVDICQAARMAGANVATVLGMDGSKGQIKEGFDADMVLLDKDLEVAQTWVGGTLHYKR